jgi:hypothetical protein
MNLARRIGAIFKLGMIASLLIAPCGAGYYYAVYMRQRDGGLDAGRRLEQALADAAARRAAQLRVLAQAQETVQRQSAVQTSAQNRYQACLSGVAATHDASWAAECKRLAEKTEQNRANCLSKLNLPKAYCDASYAPREASPNCTLPDEISTVLDADLAQARHRCVRELNADAHGL